MPTPFHEAFVEEIRALLGDQTDAFFDEMERPCRHSLRLNPLRGDAGQAVQVLSDRAMEQGGADNTTVIVCMAEGLAFAGNRKWLFPWKHS